MDVRCYTGIIIEKDGRFLVAYCQITGELIWRDSPWDAWITRKRDKALMVAEKVKGNRFLFNPVVGQIRQMTL